MAHRRADVVSAAVRILNEYGLADLTMRRLARELDVQPSALYHHFADKQSLLAAVADRIVAPVVVSEKLDDWSSEAFEVATSLRSALLAYRDGAEVVAAAHAFDLGAASAKEALAASTARLPEPMSTQVASTLWHFILGYVQDEQLHHLVGGSAPTAPDPTENFVAGVELILGGAAARTGDVTVNSTS